MTEQEFKAWVEPFSRILCKQVTLESKGYSKKNFRMRILRLQWYLLKLWRFRSRRRIRNQLEKLNINK